MAVSRVLHIGKYFPPHRGGMEAFLRSLMAEQQRCGLRVHALVHSSHRGFSSSREEMEWQGQSLPVTRCARWFTLAFAPISPGFAFTLRKLIRDHGPQILHIHFPNPSAFWCLLLPSARRLPWVLHWHSDVVPSKHKRSLRLLYSLYRIPERWMLQRASRVIATSPPYLDASQPLEDFRDKCTVVPLGVDDLAADPEQKPAPEQGAVCENASAVARLRVLAVGRLTYYKGFNYLLEAIAGAPDTTLTLVGDGEEREALLALAQRLGLQERFEHIRDCDDHELQALYASHDVFCLPSIERTEAFGVVLLEAMRAGMPCVVTDVAGSGMRWVVDAPTSGCVVPCEDSVALAKMLNTMAADRAMLLRLRRSAHSRFTSLFRISAISQPISDAYAKLQAEDR